MAATLATVLLATLVACVPPESPPDPYGLRASTGDESITLTWQAPGDADVASYDVQVLADGGAWQDLATTSATTATFTDGDVRTRYQFRVRTAASGSSDPGAWSRAVVGWFVDLVLPVVRIDTVGGAPILDRENYVPGSVSIEPNGSGYAAYTGTMGIRGRGNSTWTYSKKPYRIKLDTKSPIMGIASERDWVLLANAVDPSQLRTYAAMQASEATDLPYTPTLRHVEVVLNGRYDGVYLLTQHNEIGPDRVDITEMGPNDNAGEALTGGYRLEIDGRLEENNEPGFRTARRVPVVVKDPDPATSQQRNYIRNRVQAFEDALHGPNFTDPVLGYRAHLHVGSFIDHYLVQEVTRNQDVFWSSTFFTKERGEDFFRFGPVWDFDRSMGTLDGVVPAPPEGFRARGRGPWSTRIFQDPAFVDEVAQRWHELRPELAQISSRMLALGADLHPAILSDLARWEYPATPDLDETNTPEFLADWWVQRMAWLDSQYPAPTP